MDVTVVIPTRDRPELLAHALHSVLEQESVSVEVLVVNDGPEGSTRRVVERFGDPRLHLLRNTGPRGVSGARNSGISAALGEWIALLDDDDLWAPGKLAAQLSAAERTGAGWAYGGHVTVDAELCVRDGAPPPLPEQVVTELRRYNAVPAGASNVMVRREILAAVGPFDTGLRTSEDWDLWLRLAETGPPAYVSRPLVALRTHPGMASRNVDVMLADIEIVARRHRIAPDRARHQRWAAWMCLESGRRQKALYHYACAVAAGDLASAGRAVVALINPGVVRRRRALPPDDQWLREADAWLRPLRAAAKRRAAAYDARPS